MSSTDYGARDPLTAAHDQTLADARALVPLVAARAALAASAARCGRADNRYALEFALSRFEASERFILQKAADAGAATESAATTRIDCASLVDKLGAADNALLARAELLPAR